MNELVIFETDFVPDVQNRYVEFVDKPIFVWKLLNDQTRTKLSSESALRYKSTVMLSVVSTETQTKF